MAKVYIRVWYIFGLSGHLRSVLFSFTALGPEGEQGVRDLALTWRAAVYAEEKRIEGLPALPARPSKPAATQSVQQLRTMAAALDS